MTTKWSPKDPSDIADYWFNWGDESLLDSGELPFLPAGTTISSYVLTVPTGISSVSDSLSTNALMVRVRLSGGSADQIYPITCKITTSDGQVFEQTKNLSVKERIK